MPNTDKKAKHSILLIDDSAPTRVWIPQKLGNSYSIIPHSSCASAHRRLREGQIDLILLEQLLPDLKGIEFARQLQAETTYAKIPIILMTRDEDPALILEAFRAGCSDFIQKPLNICELHARIEKNLERLTITRYYQQSLHELKRRAEHDPLTGLFNRQALFDASRKEIAKTRRTAQSLALLLIDIDDFKTINDTYGHIAGDKLLTQFASILSGTTREYDIVGRYGGDEFVILLPHVNGAQAVSVAEKIISAVNTTDFEFRGRTVKTSPSIGISTYEQLSDAQQASGDELMTMIELADRALYRAKQAGKNQMALDS